MFGPILSVSEYIREHVEFFAFVSTNRITSPFLKRGLITEGERKNVSGPLVIRQVESVDSREPFCSLKDPPPRSSSSSSPSEFERSSNWFYELRVSLGQRRGESREIRWISKEGKCILEGKAVDKPL